MAASESSENDAIEFEYKYYCFMLREVEQFMPSNQEHREKLMRWIHRLVDPLPGSDIRSKRNRYLFMICSALLTGNGFQFLNIAGRHHLKHDKKEDVKVAGMRSQRPSTKISNEHGLPNTLALALNPETFEPIDTYPEWQKQNCWAIRLKTIEDNAKLALDIKIQTTVAKPARMCSVHPNECPTEDVQKKIGLCLDNQFKFLLYLAETYQQVTTCEKERTNLWLQALCKIDKDACVEMKGIRNDYAMLMVGYLMNNELKGPFEDLPTSCLQPLTQAIATYIAKRKSDPKKEDKGKVPLNPVSETVEAFMNHVPKIVEGAFALLSINGSMFNN